jgi:protein-tyrosine phosphatase
MIDLHCHLLPGIDDGPDTVEESIELARDLASDGVRVVAATPHLRDDHPGVVPHELAERTRELQAAIELGGVPLDVRPGAEVDLTRGLSASDEELRQASLGQSGDFLLVETPYGPLPHFFEERLFELSVRGYRILLAHPERNPSFQSDFERLRRLVARDVAVQVTASSLLRSPRSSRSAKFAHGALKAGLVHILASDAHGRAVERSMLGTGLERARKLVGDPVKTLVCEGPAAILAGEAPPSLPGEGRSRGRFGRLRR